MVSIAIFVSTATHLYLFLVPLKDVKPSIKLEGSVEVAFKVPETAGQNEVDRRKQAQMKAARIEKRKTWLAGISKLLRCHNCYINFPDFRALRSHINREHDRVDFMFECPYCVNMIEGGRIRVEKHLKKKHPGNDFDLISALKIDKYWRRNRSL